MSTVSKVNSSWLNTFLSKKRTNEIPKHEERDILNDVYIRDFFKNINDDVISYNEQENEINHESLFVTGNNHNIDIENESPMNHDETLLYDNNSNDEITSILKKDHVYELRIWNLPYKATEKDILNFISKYNIHLSNLNLIKEKDSDISTGIAFAQAINENELQNAIKTLHLQNFMGREFKIASKLNSDQRRLSSSNIMHRYFIGGTDISIKCNLCGQVGHKQNDCTNTIEECCHLCAGKDHDSGCYYSSLILIVLSSCMNLIYRELSKYYLLSMWNIWSSFKNV